MPKGVYSRMSAEERFAQYHKPGRKGCWIWTGTKRGNGYGTFWFQGRLVAAHRMALFLRKGVALRGSLVADHLCRNTMCVNPDHLEMVTVKENCLRGIGAAGVNARKTHCRRGHELAGKNLRIINNKRYCKTCSVLSTKQWRARQ
jgi:hypothetical protein